MTNHSKSRHPLYLRALGVVSALVVCCLCAPLSGMAQTKNAPSMAFDLFKEGKFDDAATKGMSDLLLQPWNHPLRLLVADSLQRVGRVVEAKIQLQALDGTSVASEARTRLSALQNSPQTEVARPAAVPLIESARPLAPMVAATSPVAPIQVVPPAPSLAVPPPPAFAPVTMPVTLPAVAPSVAFVAVNSQAVVTPGGSLLQLAPFQYIPPAGARVVDQADQPKRSPDQQRIVDLNAAGDYQAAGTAGLALQEKGGMDDELKLIFANSLAWSGRLSEARQAYQGLTTGKLANEGNIGLANIDRWLGYDHRAAPVYQSVLAKDPENPDARLGLEMTSRELSPRTMLTYGGSTDSSDLNTRSLTANHRWRDSSGANIMEIETSRFRASLPGIETDQRDATFRYRSLEQEYRPSFEVSSIGNAVFGSVGVALGERPILVEVGVVNWGRFSTNPNAIAANLSASHLGLQASHGFSFGKLVGRVDGYGVSDGNTIWTSSLRLSPNWRPLGSHFKPLIGLETRDAKFNTPNYWSPAKGTGSVYAGLMGEWAEDAWNLYASAQVGIPVYGEAGDSWSWTAGAKRWLTGDIALGFSLWGLSSLRDNAPYRANTFAVSLEKLWR